MNKAILFDALVPAGITSIHVEFDDQGFIQQHSKDLVESLERAFDLLEGIAEKLLYEEGQPVTALESREIEDIYNDAICELAPFETLIRKARGQS